MKKKSLGDGTVQSPRLGSSESDAVFESLADEV